MMNIRKQIITDNKNKPVAVQIDYDDWCRIEQALDEFGSQQKPTNLSEHIGKLDWPIDGLEYQRRIRGEWN